MNNKLLEQLINSLTKSEKRYFKIHSSVVKTNHTLINLFNLIEKGVEDEKIYLKTLKVGSKANLAVLETRLHQLIMKHLRNFHSTNTINSELKNLLIEIEILYSKRLFKNCGKTILRAKKIAEKYNEHLTLLEILKWESFIEKEEGKYLYHSQEKLKSILKQEQTVIDNYRRLANYKYHTFNLLLLSKNKAIATLNEELSEYYKLIEDKFFELKPEHSFDEKLYILNFNGMYNMTKGNFSACLENYIKLVYIIENSTRKNILKSSEYFLGLNNLLLIQVMNKQFEDSRNTLSKIYKQFSGLSTYEPLLFNVTQNYELGIYCEIGEAKKGLEILPEIIVNLKKYPSETYQINKLLFYLNIAIMFLFNKKYKESIFWLNEFLNDYSIKKNDVASNIYYYGQIINMLVHFEAKNFDSMNYLYNESTNNLKKIRPINKFDNTVLTFLKNYASEIYDSESKSKKVFEDLKTKLNKITKDPNETISLHFFDFYAWIDSHLTNKSIADIIKTKNLTKSK